MKTFLNIIYWLSIAWILFCICFLGFGGSIPLRFIKPQISEAFFTLVWFTFPVAILLTLARHKPAGRGNKGEHIMGAAAVVAFLLVGCTKCNRTLCNDDHYDVLFVNKNDSSQKIVRRSYGCGAWDSGPSQYKYYREKPLTKYLMYSKRVDTLKIDVEQWLRSSN